MSADGDTSSGERAFRRLMHDSHLATADLLPQLVAAAGEDIGGRHAELLVVDHAQRRLLPLHPDGDPRAIEGTVAGRAFRRIAPQAVVRSDGTRLWVPLLDGLERLGVLGITFDAVTDAVSERVRQLAALSAELLLSKGMLSDSVHRAARLQEMSMAAEMQWSLMPPLTAGTDDVAVAAMMEPAYEVGGDVADYSLEQDVAHFAILDAMGHGLHASLVAALAIGCYRSRRRAGDPLPDIVQAMDAVIAEEFGRRSHVTAVLATLELGSGRLQWLNAGHPAPLLLRGRRVVKELSGRALYPLGLGLNDDRPPPDVREEHLQPGDRVLLYTDGVLDAVTAEGEPFGFDRLVDFIGQAEAAGEPIAETMRRLSRDLFGDDRSRLRDDATQLLVEWRTGTARQMLDRLNRPPRVTGEPGG